MEDGTPHLQCDIELVVNGANYKAINKWVADAIHELANQIEKNEFETGFHDANDRVGKKIGTIYPDQYASDEIL